MNRTIKNIAKKATKRVLISVLITERNSVNVMSVTGGRTKKDIYRHNMIGVAKRTAVQYAREYNVEARK